MKTIRFVALVCRALVPTTTILLGLVAEISVERASAQTTLAGFSEGDSRLVGYRVVSTGSSVKLVTIGVTSVTKGVGYVFGQFSGRSDKEILQVRRAGKRHYVFSSITSDEERIVRRLRLSHAVGSECHILSGFDIDGNGHDDLAIVDITGRRHRWTVVENPLDASVRERQSFLHGFHGERVEWAQSNKRGIEYVSLRQSPHSKRVRALLRSAEFGTVRSLRGRWEEASGLLIPIRLSDNSRFDPGMALYSPAKGSLYTFSGASSLKTHLLPEPRCQGYQIVTNLSGDGTVSTLELCSEGVYVTAERGVAPGVSRDAVTGSGALEVPISRARVGDQTRLLDGIGESAVGIPRVGSDGTSAYDPQPRAPPRPSPTPTSDLTPVITATPTAGVSKLSIAGAPAISLGITRQLRALKDTGTTVEDSTPQSVWSSSDEAIATVSSTGLVTGVTVGTVTITATLGSDRASRTFSVARGGELVSSFNQGLPLSMPFGDGANNDIGRAIVVTRDDELLVLASLNGDIGLMKFNLSGELVQNFGVQGKLRINLGAFEWPWSMIEHDGKYLIAGATGPTGPIDGLVVRINSDGTLDSTFGNNGVAIVDAGGSLDLVYGARVAENGMIYMAGTKNDGQGGFLARLTSQGSLDSSFGNGGFIIGGLSGEFGYAQALSDGKIVVSGYAPYYPADAIIARYLPNGAPDPTFGVMGFSRRPLSANYNKVRSLLVDSQGRYLAGGWHSNVLDPASGLDACVVRWNADGTADSTFGVGDYRCVPFGGTGGNEQARDIFDGGDGTTIVVGSGTSSSSSGTHRSGIARLLPNGALDPWFGSEGIWRISGVATSNQMLSGVTHPKTGVVYATGYVSNPSTGNDVLLVALNP